MPHLEGLERVASERPSSRMRWGGNLGGSLGRKRSFPLALLRTLPRLRFRPRLPHAVVSGEEREEDFPYDSGCHTSSLGRTQNLPLVLLRRLPRMTN